MMNKVASASHTSILTELSGYTWHLRDKGPYRVDAKVLPSFVQRVCQDGRDDGMDQGV